MNFFGLFRFFILLCACFISLSFRSASNKIIDDFKQLKEEESRIRFLNDTNISQLDAVAFDSILSIIRQLNSPKLEAYWHYQNVQYTSIFHRSNANYWWSLNSMGKIADEHHLEVESTVANFRSSLASYGGKKISEQEMYYAYLNCFEQIRKLGVARFDLYGSDWILCEIGRNFYELNDYENALACLKLAEQEIKTRTHFYLLTLNLIESVYANSGKFQDAIVYAYKINKLQFSFPQDKELEQWLFKYWKCLSYLNMADYFLELGKFQQSDYYLQKGIKLVPKNPDFSVNHKVVAEYDALQVVIKVLLGLNRVKEAEPLLLRLELLKKNLGNGMPSFYFRPLKLYKNYSTYYEKKHDFKRAFYYLNLQNVLQDSLNKRNDKRSLWQSEMRLKSEMFLSELKHAEEATTFQKTLRNSAIAFIIFILITGLIIYKRIKNDNRIIVSQKISLEESLQEKEILLKEVHHRVKNNLQIISGLLEKQAEKTEDPLTKQLMREGQDRVLSMALVHQNLYQSKNLSAIELKPYIQMISKNIRQSHAADEFRIQVDLNLQDLFVNIDTAIALGLILNELITNCYKYAFKDMQNGEIGISVFATSLEFVMKVSDNGIGLPDSFDINHRNTLGMSLIKGLVRQLNGRFEFDSSKGSTTFSVFCPR